MTRPKKPKAPRRTVEPESGKKHSDLLPQDRQVKLGVKYVCFSCAARFTVAVVKSMRGSDIASIS